MLTYRRGIAGVALLGVGIGLLGYGQSAGWAQTTAPNPAFTAVYPYGRVVPNEPFSMPFWNGYPRNYYSYSVSNLLPTYLTSINYPRIYGAYSYGMAPGAYTEGAMPSPYAVAPSGFRSVYPPAVAPVPSLLTVEPVPENAVAHVLVHVPLGADLWFDNVRTAQTGSERRFVTPPLLPGRSYVYDVRATWIEGRGREVTQNRQIRVFGGQRLSVDFGPASETETSTLRTRALP